MFGFFGKKGGLRIATSNLKKQYGLTLDKTPNKRSIIDNFERMSAEATLSAEAQTALLYRLVVMNYLAAASIMRNSGEIIDPSRLLWLTELADASVDWSEKANDHVTLEELTSPLNMNIFRFFEFLGIHYGGPA